MASQDQRAALGRAGERHARLYLEAQGYRFVAANWHCSVGELDLVMLDGPEVVFVEVKTRTGMRAGHASDAATGIKAQRVLDAAEHYLALHQDLDGKVWRCDIIAITLGKQATVRSLEHYVNAIYED